MSEKNRLENIAKDYSNPLSAQEISKIEIEHCFNLIKQFCKLESVLELGPANGIMSALLKNNCKDLTLVEGAGEFYEQLKDKYRVHHCLFEDFKPNKKYNLIILGHVLEHVEHPIEILKLAKNWLDSNQQDRLHSAKIGGGGGRARMNYKSAQKFNNCIFCAVPNADSLHRIAAIDLGLLKNKFDKSPADIFHGHRRIYTLKSLKNDFLKAGFEILLCGGYFLKPLSNAQILASWDKKLIKTFMKLGQKYPQIAGDIFIIARPK